MPTINKKTVVLNRSTKKQERQKYYASTQWKNLRKIYLQSHPLCEKCLENDIITGEHLSVHHILSPFDPNISEMERWQRLLEYGNLTTLCEECHGKLHAEEQKKRKNAKKHPKWVEFENFSK